METLDSIYGFNMLNLNRMLPRTYTENRVDSMLLRIYLSRNNFLTGVFFSSDTAGFDVASPNDYYAGKDKL